MQKVTSRTKCSALKLWLNFTYTPTQLSSIKLIFFNVFLYADYKFVNYIFRKQILLKIWRFSCCIIFSTCPIFAHEYVCYFPCLHCVAHVHLNINNILSDMDLWACAPFFLLHLLRMRNLFVPIFWTIVWFSSLVSIVLYSRVSIAFYCAYPVLFADSVTAILSSRYIYIFNFIWLLVVAAAWITLKW